MPLQNRRVLGFAARSGWKFQLLANNKARRAAGPGDIRHERIVISQWITGRNQAWLVLAIHGSLARTTYPVAHVCYRSSQLSVRMQYRDTYQFREWDYSAKLHVQRIVCFRCYSRLYSKAVFSYPSKDHALLR